MYLLFLASVLIIFFLWLTHSCFYNIWPFIVLTDSQKTLEHLSHAFSFYYIVQTYKSREFAEHGINHCHQNFLWPEGNLSSSRQPSCQMYLVALTSVGVCCLRGHLHTFFCSEIKSLSHTNTFKVLLISPLSCLHMESSSISRWHN